MINYTNYFKKTINSENLIEYRKESGKHNLSLHFDGKKSWGEGFVLDYGGRIGEKTSMLKNVIVVEQDSDAIKWMKKNNIACSEAKNLLIDYKSKKIDMIYASHVLEHVTNPIQTLLDFYTVLDDEGLLIIALPSDFATLRPQVKEIDGGGDEHLFCWNFTEIKNLLIESGFIVTDYKLNTIPYRVGKAFNGLNKFKFWQLIWLVLNTLRWWTNIITFLINKKAKLSTLGEIILYAKKK